MRIFLNTMCALLAALLCAPALPSEQTVSNAVLVTGASSGIGRKITERLATEGYFVYATARKAEDLKALGAIKNVHPIRLDVTQPADIAAAVETVTRAGRGLHGLVNNAGVATFGTIATMRMEEFDLTMKVNVYGPVMMIKAFAPLIIAGKGRIVNIGSPSGITDGGGPDIAAYVMSKHAIEGLTDSLVLQLAPLGVQVSAVEPGAYRSEIDKNMLERLTEAEKANMLKVWGPPPDPMMFPEADEVAVAVAQALSEPNPKRRYLAIPRDARDRFNNRLPERIIRYQMKQLVQWNEGHAYTFDRAALIKMLDDALVNARPRTSE
ncbi:SDR family NAD(P)-dependent oxidoreductase [Steroidobacter agaridevorans]|uniref:SDR family NAD(P)-dependent oxidoreductase n=1 Tax=Steroidobacter agaridevorans TaxID=2695856 RepID=UPI00132A6A9C|nr:SDR family NAD(P)-dependent oxidoreductase [Steroidobacter agaridevorans]GFE86540.1 short-chain dehydrogenase/reductase [Steroidobacter agaridevorans]